MCTDLCILSFIAPFHSQLLQSDVGGGRTKISQATLIFFESFLSVFQLLYYITKNELSMGASYTS